MVTIVSNDTNVPVITKRHRIHQRVIDETVQQIMDQFTPYRIILFGSYAYGQPRPESNVDLLLVMDTQLKEIEQAVQICRSTEYHYGLDLIVRTPNALEKRLALGDPFLCEIVKNGKVLYERVDNRVG